MKNFTFAAIFAALLSPFIATAAQESEDLGGLENEMLSGSALTHEVANVTPNEDKNKGLLMYATSLNDYWRERGWYEIRLKQPQNANKIKTWDPGSGSYVDGLGCGSWGGDAYYAYRVLLYDLGYDYPDSFVKVDVKTGNYTVIKQFSPSDDLRKNWNKYRLYCMTYNPKKDVIYAYGQTALTSGQSVTSLYQIDKTNGNHTKIKDFDFISFSMAVDYDGFLWVQTGIYEDGVHVGDKILCMDPEDNFNVIKTVDLSSYDAPFKTSYYGTMSFDYTTGDLYWLAASGTFVNSQNLYSIDLESGNMTYYGNVWGAMVGLYIPYVVADNPAAPASVRNLKAVPAYDGALSCVLTWKNPTTQWNRETLTDLDKIRIYRKGETEPAVDLSVTSAQIGMDMSWEDENAHAGLNTYYVVPYSNKWGNGIKDSIEVLVGDDVPVAVNNVVIENNVTSVKLSWNAPKYGANGGYINPDNLKYTVMRFPDNVVIADKISETTITDNNFAGQLCYYYTIQPFNDFGSGDVVKSKEFIAGEAYNVPLTFNFKEEIYANVWTDLGQWGWSPGTNSGDERMTTSLKTSENNWLISPDFNLEKGKKYRFKSIVITDYGQDSSYSFKFALGKGKTTDAMDKIIRDEADYRADENSSTETLYDIVEVEETGVYNFGVNVTNITGAQTFGLMELSIDEVLDVDLAAVEIKNLEDAVYNRETSCSVVVFNNGSESVSEYAVKVARIDDDGNPIVLGEAENVPELAPGDKIDVLVTFNPDIEYDMSIVGWVETEKDANIDNNRTDVYIQTVFPEDFVDFNRIIIDESALDVYTRAPLSFCFSETMSQTIYLEEEINVEYNSRIKRIAYQYDGNEISEVHGPVSVKVYMCNTDKDVYSSENDAIPVNQMKLVWEGDVSINPGEDNTLEFFLNEEFVYAKGKNLCIALVKSGSVGNDYPACFKVFNEPFSVTRTIVDDNMLINVWYVPVLQLALVEDPDAVAVDSVISDGQNVWFNSANSTLNFVGKQIENVNVYDLSGKMIDNFIISEGVDSIPLSLPAGVYVAQVIDVNGNVENIKINVVK